jgi:hypothetical protein
MSRFQVGQELFVIHFSIVGKLVNNFFTLPHERKIDEIGDITIKKLVVKEAHVVKDAHTGNDQDAPDLEGYILHDEDGVEFFNQYPKANQTSGTGYEDLLFTHDIVPDIEDQKPYQFRLLTSVVDYLLNGEGLSAELASAREDLFHVIDDDLRAFGKDIRVIATTGDGATPILVSELLDLQPKEEA